MASNYPTTTTAGVLGNGGNVTDAHHGVWSPVDVAGRYERTIAGLLSAYGPPATFGIGIVGHVTSLFVLSRLYGNLPSTSLYLIVGLVIDLPVLYVRSGNASIKQVRDRR